MGKVFVGHDWGSMVVWQTALLYPDEQRRVVAIDYLKDNDGAPSERLVEPYTFERVLPNWLIHTWDRSANAERSFRLDRIRSMRATGATFEVPVFGR